MPVPRGQPTANPEETHGTLFNWVYLLIVGHAACVWPFCRKDFGTAVFSLAGPVALAVMYVYAAFAGCPEMAWYAAVWFALVLFHRSVTLAKRARGWDTHSGYDGEPWLAQAIFRPLPGEYAAKARCEPLLCVVAGGLLSLAWPVLGAFVASVSVSLALKKGVERSIEDRQLRAWKDKEFEMRYLFERYRSGR